MKGRKGKSKGGKAAGEVTSDEEVSDVDKLMEEIQDAALPARPKPRTVRRVDHTDGSNPPSEIDEPELQNGNPVEDMTTAKTPPRPKAIYRTKSPQKSP